MIERVSCTVTYRAEPELTPRFSVALWSYNGAPNQKWEAHANLEGDWSFRNVWDGSYLGIQGNVSAGATLIGVQSPVYFSLHNNYLDPMNVIRQVFLTNPFGVCDAQLCSSLIPSKDKSLFVRIADWVVEDGNRVQLEHFAFGDDRDIQLWRAQCDTAAPFINQTLKLAPQVSTRISQGISWSALATVDDFSRASPTVAQSETVVDVCVIA